MTGTRRPPAQEPAEHWGYHDWRFTSLCGPTPQFAWPGLKITAACAVAPADWPQWWRVAQLLIADLQGRHPSLKPWLDQLRQHPSLPPGQPPAATAWQTLEAAMALPPSPLQLADPVRDGVPGALQMHCACPYERLVVQGMQLISIWLAWSHQAWRMGRLTPSARLVQRWCTGFDQLNPLLPAPPLRALHQRLRQLEIAWQWLGGDQTRIGSGNRQRLVQGVPPDLDLTDPSSWQVPIYTVTGSVGKTTTARLLWQLLQPSCSGLALTASDGAWIGSGKVSEGDCIGGHTARRLLAVPSVQAAVFEQGRGGLIQQGVPYSRSDVAILLNVQAVHLGRDGVQSIAQMAEVKAVGLQPARLLVLNLEDEQCRRLGSLRDPADCVWFGVEPSGDSLRTCSRSARAAVGLERDGRGEPVAVLVWERGDLAHRISLDGVAPYHGFLGRKTLEQLLAVVAAAWVGPLPVTDWPARLRGLRLDSSNHRFRTSVHPQGRFLFVLDKAAEPASLQLLLRSVEELAQRHNCSHRLLVLCRGPMDPRQTHVEAMRCLHPSFDAFVCFDRPDSYASPRARPEYAIGDVPRLLVETLEESNASSGLAKPVVLQPDWLAVERYLRRSLPGLAGRILVVINQPSTQTKELNQRILDVVLGDWSASAGEAPAA